jgi:hypothetical protein
MAFGNLGIMVGSAAKTGLDTYTRLKAEDRADKQLGFQEASAKREAERYAYEQADRQADLDAGAAYASGGTITGTTAGATPGAVDAGGVRFQGNEQADEFVRESRRGGVDPVASAAPSEPAAIRKSFNTASEEAANIYAKRGKFDKAEGVRKLGKARTFEDSLKPVQEFMQRGGTPEEFYDTFLRPVHDSKKNPLNVFPVKGEDGTTKFAVIDKASGTNQVMGLDKMVQGYVGILHAVNGDFDKYLSMNAEQRKELMEDKKLKIQEGELGVKQDAQKTTAEHYKDWKSIMEDNNLTKIEMATIRAEAAAASREARAAKKGPPIGMSDDGTKMMYADGSTVAVPEGFSNVFPKVRGNEGRGLPDKMKDELTKQFATEIATLDPNDKNYQKKLAGVHRKYQSSGLETAFEDPIIKALGGKGDPFAPAGKGVPTPKEKVPNPRASPTAIPVPPSPPADTRENRMAADPALRHLDTQASEALARMRAGDPKGLEDFNKFSTQRRLYIENKHQ